MEKRLTDVAESRSISKPPWVEPIIVSIAGIRLLLKVLLISPASPATKLMTPLGKSMRSKILPRYRVDRGVWWRA